MTKVMQTNLYVTFLFQIFKGSGQVCEWSCCKETKEVHIELGGQLYCPVTLPPLRMTKAQVLTISAPAWHVLDEILGFYGLFLNESSSICRP
jgi:hypothetical protein